MQPKHALFHSHQTRQSFWILLIGCLLIIGASLSVFSIYLLHGRRSATIQHLAINVIRAVTLARAVSPDELPQTVRLLSGGGLRVEMSPKPLLAPLTAPLTDPHKLHDYVVRNPDRIQISVPLANGQWLNIRTHRVDHTWLIVGLVFSGAVLLFALVFLCLWTIKRLDLPLRRFSEAAKQFGVDIESPPLAPIGPPEMQDVIQAFNEMQNRIRRLLHDRTQMLAAISHDLRTPITRLQLRAEYLKGTTQYEKAVADLKEMENMISSILSFARDHVRSEKRERFDLNALLESLCNDLVDVGHDVTYHSDLERMPYFARIGALKRAFANLIENAVKYGDKAEVTLKQNDKDVQIRICDEGPGIPEDQLEKVFAPFYRVDAARSPNKSGTGLGLAVARDIIRAHGGDIILKNRDPKGLTVIVTLPLQIENS